HFLIIWMTSVLTYPIIYVIYVDNEQDRAYYAEHPKEALWWVKERKN
ncbi:hypothetical protein ACQKH8_06880, partial [Staphylococcus aureus]